MPGTEAALQWAAEVLFDNCSVEEVIGKEEWILEGRNMSSVEHAERLALLLGRASTVAAPRVRVVSLERTKLDPAGAAAIGKALMFNRGADQPRAPRQQLGRRGEGSDSRCGERAGRVQAQDVSVKSESGRRRGACMN